MKLRIHRYDDNIIEDLGISFAFTNSERNQLGCPRQWYFSYSQGLSTKRTSNAFAWGIAWHMLMEDLFNFWKEHDRLINHTDPFFNESFDKIEEFLEEEQANSEEVIKDMRIALEGYLIRYGDIFTQFRVVEVECALRYPIKDFNGNLFKTHLYLERIGDRLEIANIDAKKKIEYTMPFWVIGRADAIVQSRSSGELFVFDHKTTGSIKRFLSTCEVDPQLCSYAAMLEYEKTEGYLQKYKNNKVGGIIYGLTSNQSTSEPKVLKNGTFSKAKSNKIPSWVFKKFAGKDELYSSHLENLKDNVDPLWHQRMYYPLDRNSINRWKMESYGTARRLADMYRCLSLFEDADSWVAPRVPTCKSTGYCQFKEVCLNDNHIMRSYYKKENRIYWSK